MSETDKAFEDLPAPPPGATSEGEETEEQVWPQMDDGSPTLSTDTDPGNRPEGHTS